MGYILITNPKHISATTWINYRIDLEIKRPENKPSGQGNCFKFGVPDRVCTETKSTPSSLLARLSVAFNSSPK